MVRMSAGIAIALGLIAPASADSPTTFAKDGAECVPIETQTLPTPRTGRVEVLEAFSYGCGHCFQMEPYIAQWLKTKPQYIDFIRIHVSGTGLNGPYSRFYYTLRALGRLDLHDAIFSSVFNNARPLSSRNGDEAFKLQLAFVTEHGIDAKTFTETYHSLPVSYEIQRAMDLLRRYQVDSTPKFIVNGQYRVSMTKLDHQTAVLSLIEDVAARLK